MLFIYNLAMIFEIFLPEGDIEIDLRGKSWNEVFRELKKIMKELGV